MLYIPKTTKGCDFFSGIDTAFQKYFCFLDTHLIDVFDGEFREMFPNNAVEYFVSYYGMAKIST